jgi:hypothetical protein
MKLSEEFLSLYDTKIKSYDAKKYIVVELYKNPIISEFEEHIAIGARGHIDINGNLYMEGYDKHIPSRVGPGPFLFLY